MRYPNFIHGSYESAAVTADQERTVNWYTERMESSGATSEAALYPTPGVAVVLQPVQGAATPEAPTVTNIGTPGGSTYSYKIVALLADGVRHTAAGPAGTTATGNLSLNGTNFNRLTWPASVGAAFYVVYRTVSWFDPEPNNIGTTAALTFDDVLGPFTIEVPSTTDTTGATTVPPGPGLAHFFQAGREFAVIGVTFYEIGVFGAYTSRGTVAIGANPATISSNGDGGGQLFITSGDNGYIFDLGTDVLSQVAALNGLATMGDHLDGYFLALDGVNSKFYISNLLDGLTWDTGTAFAQRSIAPDPWVSLKVNGRYIWLLGEQTSEVWYDTGASPFPFAPHPSGLIPFGIAAPFTVAVADGVIIWLGASRIGDAFVLRASGFTPEVVSDYPRQRIFNGYTTISDAVADTYNDQGHTFYLLTFPTEDVTWSWDVREGSWTERGTWISEQNEFIAWRPRWHAMAHGEHRMLDASTGHVYRMAPGLTSDVDDRLIRRMRRAPALTAENQRIFYGSFELDLEPGLGTSTGQGEDPQVMLRWSDDGGKTWGPELLRSAGKIGEYGQRVIWNRLGSARRRVFEVSVSDPIAWRLTAAFLTLAQPLKGVPKQQQQAQA